VRQRATKALVEPLQGSDDGCVWVPTVICNSEEGMERPAHPWRGECTRMWNSAVTFGCLNTGKSPRAVCVLSFVRINDYCWLFCACTAIIAVADAPMRAHMT
jgi:hypothetical protein